MAKSKQLSELDVKSLLQAEKSASLAALSASTLVTERAKALDYYKGDMSADMPAQTGRSNVVSLDVADTVEGLMPSLMEVFCGTDDVVRFDPVGPEDVAAAEQETDYVNHIFMAQNPGFMILYTLIKDALLSKIGIGKVWSEEQEQQKTERYYDQPDDALAAIAADEEVEIVAHTAHEEQTPLGPVTLHDIEVRTKKKLVKHKVKNVPPEQFGISRNALTIKDAHYCYEEEHKTESELIEMGYDADQIKALPTHVLTAWSTGVEAIARDTVDESTYSGSSEVNTANRLVKITEHYVMMDYDGDGHACRYRVVTGGDQGDILKRNGELAIEEVEDNPFFSITPLPQPHRFEGRSIADTVLEIQKIKTALVRAKLDNLYLHNNPRVEVAEAMASENTIDDLLVSRPGGLVRVRQPGGINWQTVPDVSQSIYPALEYWDTVREWRTGVTRAGQGIDADSLQSTTASAVNQMYNAAQQKMKLIARIFAETGIKDLFNLLHGTIRKYGDQEQTVRLRNNWVKVNPRDWRERMDMTVCVGLGDGGKSAKIAGLLQIINYQAQAMAAGKSNLVDDQKIFNSARRLIELIGYKDVTSYINDPSEKNPDGTPAHPPPPPQQDPKLQIELLKQQSQMAANNQKAQLEQQKAQVDTAHQAARTQADIMLAEKKHQLDAQLKVLEMQLKERESAMEMRMKEMQMAHQHAVNQQQLAHERDLHQLTLAQGAQVHDTKLHQGRTAHAEKLSQGDETHKQKIKHMEEESSASEKAEAAPKKKDGESLKQGAEILQSVIKELNRPKKIVRDKDGRAIGSEPA